jgi:guanylate kinase
MTDSARSFGRRGLLLVLSSPSGAGKSTIAKRLLAADGEIAMSVSATTRPIRAGEIDGKDYHFIDSDQFEDMVQAGAFLEWATVFDNRYGTPRSSVEARIAEGGDVLFDIDWQGAQQLHQKMGQDIVRIFIMPPSMEELERRLRGRGTDSDEVISRRMERAAHEISHWDGYDYVLINDDVDRCFAQVHEILRVERLKRRRQAGLTDFVRSLIG